MIYDFENVDELYEKELMTKFILGHLALENKMICLLVLSYPNKSIKKINKWRFSEKLELLFKNDVIDDGLYNLVKAVNKIRNNYAHNFSYEISHEEIFELLKLAGSAGVDFSDEGIYSDYQHYSNYYSNSDAIIELMVNLNFHFCYIMEDKGFDINY